MQRIYDRIEQSAEHGCFVRCIGVNDDHLRDIAMLDERFARDDGYVRVSKGDMQQDKEATEKLRPAADSFAQSPQVSKVMELYRSSVAAVNPTIENNLLISLMYWQSKLLQRDKGILVYCGRIGYKEYLFCYLAYLRGWSAIMLLPEGEGGLSAVLTEKSELLELGEKRSVTIPPYDREAVLSAISSAAAPIAPRSARISERGNIKVAIPPRERRKGKSLSAADSAAVAVTQTASVSSQRENVKVTIPSREGRRSAADRHATPRRELSYEELAKLAESVVMVAVCDEKGEIVGNGSGIAISEKGYILTNCHVIRHGGSFLVRLENDERAYPVQVIKYHSVHDMALIRIQRKLKPLPLYTGKADLVRGQRVVAIGSPMGLFNTVSDGIISGFRRMRETETIQFTAPISPGSSGGALLNVCGELIGVCFGGVDQGQNLNLAVSCREIEPFIRGFI